MGLAALLDLVAPSRCAVCGDGGPVICEPCSAILTRIRPPICVRCGRPCVHAVDRCRDCAGRRPAYATARAALVLDDHAGRLLRAWKDRGLEVLARIAAAELLAALPPPAPAPRRRWRTSSARRGGSPSTTGCSGARSR